LGSTARASRLAQFAKNPLEAGFLRLRNGITNLGALAHLVQAITDNEMKNAFNAITAVPHHQFLENVSAACHD
jgi:hypothetical protein